MKLVACEILIPLLDDRTRQPHPEDVLAGWRRELAQRFGGYTIRGVVQGMWRDEDGKFVGEESFCYLVSVESSRVEELRSFARAACKTFAQRCIYFQIVGEAELLYPDE